MKIVQIKTDLAAKPGNFFEMIYNFMVLGEKVMFFEKHFPEMFGPKFDFLALSPTQPTNC